MSQDAMSLLFIELRKRLKEIDWIDTPYLQIAMDTGGEWLQYQKELKAIPLLIDKGEIDPPTIVNGFLHFSGWPDLPSDSESSWDKMANFSERECQKISRKKTK